MVVVIWRARGTRTCRCKDMVRKPKPYLSVCLSVVTTDRRILETDYFENVRFDFFRRNVTIIFEELAACRAKIVGLFVVPTDLFGIVPFTDFGLTVYLSCSQ